jgi:hypothetical protein
MERTTGMMETAIPKGRTLRIRDGKDLEPRSLRARWVYQDNRKTSWSMPATDFA